MSLGTPTLLTSGSSATDATSYSTASVTLASGNAYILVLSAGLVGTPSQPTLSGNGAGSWTEIAIASTPNTNVTVAAWYITGTGTTGAVTMNFALTQGNCAWRIVEITGAANPPVRQHLITAETQTVTTATLPGSPLSTSLSLSLFGYNAGSAQTMTLGAGYTMLGTRTSLTSPANSFHLGYDPPSPATSATWTCSNSSGKVHLLLEIAEAVVEEPAGVQMDVIVAGAKRAGTPYVIVGGVKRTVSSASVIIGGVKRSLTP